MRESDELTALKEAFAGFLSHPDAPCPCPEADLLANLLVPYRQDHLDYREVCENLYDGVHIADGEGRILFVNDAYTRTTGIRSEEVLGRKVADVEAEGTFYKGSVTTEVIRTRARVDSIATIYRLNKEVLVTGIPVLNEAGEVKLVVTLTRDFPELKNLERQLLALMEESRKSNEELAYLRSQQAGNKQLLYRSAAMAGVMGTIASISPTDVTVLITGESGTGKELVASEIYQNSGRSGMPFIKVNCAAIPADLLESELFGYEEGAFTGARKNGKPGMFELANSGTILLDEIGDLPLPLQAKLLRVLQQKEFMRIGGTTPIQLDIRILASTNKDLREEVRQGRFRKDLYYRLNVVPIELKPLRERREDIPLLVEHFFQVFNKKHGKEVSLTPGGMDLMLDYTWPGNIREMENLIERMVVTCSDGSINRGQVFSALDLGKTSLSPHSQGGSGLKQLVAAYEREIILQALEQKGSIRKAAEALGIDHSTLVKKCKRYALDVDLPGGSILHQPGE